MMLILRDDPVIEVFASADNAPNWIEPIGIENEEKCFCDDNGQRCAGLITSLPGGSDLLSLFSVRWGPDMANAIPLVDRAVGIEPNDEFTDLLRSKAKWSTERKRKP